MSKPSLWTRAISLIAGDLIHLTKTPATDPTSETIAIENLILAIFGARAGADVGTANARTFTPVPAVAALVTGMRFTLKSSVANTGATTLAVSGLAAVTIKKSVSSDLGAGDIALGAMYEVMYDGTNFQLIKNA